MKSLQLPRTLVNQLLTQAQKNTEIEACGLIGHSDQGFSLYPVDNIARQSEQLFEMDPQQQIAAMKAMREKGEQLFAIYHSHPNAPASPSATDWEQMSYKDVYYLIISLNTVGVLEMTAYWPAKNNFAKVALEIS